MWRILLILLFWGLYFGSHYPRCFLLKHYLWSSDCLSGSSDLTAVRCSVYDSCMRVCALLDGSVCAACFLFFVFVCCFVALLFFVFFLFESV